MNRFVLFSVLSSACVFPTETTIEHSDVEVGTPVDAISLDIHAGDVTVIVGDVERTQVNRILRYGRNPPELDAFMDGSTLVLEARCPGLGQCSVDHEIVLPRSAALDASTGSGNVLVIGLLDDVVIETGSGDVDLEDIEGELVVGTGSGDVDGRGLTAATVSVDTGSGDVDLRLDAAPSDLFVNTGSGDVGAVLPSGSYRIKTSTGSGDVSIDGLTSDSTSNDHIQIETGSGDINIRGI